MPESPPDSTAARREISRGTVKIYKEYLGRGPTHSRTFIDRDVVTVLCEDGLTLAERKLVEVGDNDAVRHVRRKFQSVMADEICRLVEGALGRTSRCLLSDHDVEKDIAIEVVVLEPEDGQAEASHLV